MQKKAQRWFSFINFSEKLLNSFCPHYEEKKVSVIFLQPLVYLSKMILPIPNISVFENVHECHETEDATLV